ncbi:MAG: bifunctional phosphopantothenoylcysteine decarboxylase/phosphopantothenate--cysteine ligase CoaBC [Polyangia bacterium]
MTAVLQDKTVVLGVTGGISAYKAAELCRLLRKAGARVEVVMTPAACAFITPLTMEALSGNPVATEMFETTAQSHIGHIELASRADIVVVAPATADAIARFAAGMANDLLATVVLATRAPVLLAPAMNSNMWDNPITQANLARLTDTGRFSTAGPDAGELACGWVGAGRLVAPAEIVAAIEARLTGAPDTPRSEGALAGRRMVVTAGPTWEAVDDVRFLGNRSSGKMGFALAHAAAMQGADVTLIAGPVALATPTGVARRVDVESALEMREALRRVAMQADVVVMAAAVADFRPGVRVLGKLSRRDQPAARPARTLPLVANPDLLAELGRARKGRTPLLVGFAAEVGVSGEALAARARQKLTEKGCDVVVANEVGKAGLGLGAEYNAVTMVFADGRVVDLPADRKEAIAMKIWDTLTNFYLTPAEAPAANKTAPVSQGISPGKGRARRGRKGNDV